MVVSGAVYRVDDESLLGSAADIRHRTVDISAARGKFHGIRILSRVEDKWLQYDDELSLLEGVQMNSSENHPRIEKTTRYTRDRLSKRRVQRGGYGRTLLLSLHFMIGRHN